jgi:hypothetical protein
LIEVNSVKDIWAELFECLPIARAFFGKVCEQKVHEIWAARAQIMTAANMYGTVDPKLDDTSNRYEAAIWEPMDDKLPGSVSSQMADVLTYMEQTCFHISPANRLSTDRATNVSSYQSPNYATPLCR